MIVIVIINVNINNICIFIITTPQPAHAVLQQREATVKEREGRVTEAEERLARAHAQIDAERARVQVCHRRPTGPAHVAQDTLARMEAHLKESKRQCELDQWRLAQDTARVQVVLPFPVHCAKWHRCGAGPAGCACRRARAAHATSSG